MKFITKFKNLKSFLIILSIIALFMDNISLSSSSFMKNKKSLIKSREELFLEEKSISKTFNQIFLKIFLGVFFHFKWFELIEFYFDQSNKFEEDSKEKIEFENNNFE